MMVRVIIGAPIRIATLAQAMYASPPHGLHHKRPVRTIKLGDQRQAGADIRRRGMAF